MSQDNPNLVIKDIFHLISFNLCFYSYHMIKHSINMILLILLTFRVVKELSSMEQTAIEETLSFTIHLCSPLQESKIILLVPVHHQIGYPM